MFKKIDRFFEVLFDDIIVPNIRKIFYVFSGLMLIVNSTIAFLAANDILSFILFFKILFITLMFELIMIAIMIVFRA